MKYRLDVKIVVIKNNTLGQIKWEQLVFLGNPEYVCDLQPVDFAAVARGFGLTAFSIERRVAVLIVASPDVARSRRRCPAVCVRRNCIYHY